MIKFGPSGNSDSFYKQGHKSSLETPEWLYNMGLDAYEYSFGRGVRIKKETAEAIGQNAKKYNIAMSLHAPYYINLATDDEEKKVKTIGYIVDTAKAAKFFGAKRIVVHPGSVGKKSRNEAMARAKDVLREALDVLHNSDLDDINICPETLGKINQLGTLDEIIDLCKLSDILIPTIDFGHLNARGRGSIKTKDDYAEILDALEVLGDRANNFHVHFSRVEYTNQGEKRHHTYSETEYGPDFEPLAELLYVRRLNPTIICESKGTMAEDAKTLKEIYLSKK